MSRNRPQLAVKPKAIARLSRERAGAAGLSFALIVISTTILLNVAPNLGARAYAATTAGDPSALVKGTVGQVLTVLQNPQMSQEARQRKVLDIVANRFDFADMARSSLGYNWKKLSPAQQDQFVPLFTAFMENAYLNKISAYSGQKVQYLGQTPTGAGAAEVKTVVTPAQSSDQPIKINYLLKQSGADWKVYDVTIDDISITANYRNQFDRVINEQGFDALMSAMRDKQQQLRESIGA
jgi:phospholipid transport system substrate-binding protein